MLAISNKSSASITYSGYANIVWSGDPFTSTKGTLYCSGPITAICCIQEGHSLWINTGGAGIWATCSPMAVEENVDALGTYSSEHIFSDAQR